MNTRPIGITAREGCSAGERLSNPIHLVGLACAMIYGVLAWFSLHPYLLSLWLFFVLLGGSFALSLLASLQIKAFSPGQVLLWAAVFRLIGCLGAPLLEDDFYRYLWDGYLFFESGSPYGVAPAVFFGDASIPQAFINLLAQINYPHVPTIYGPTLEYSFLLSHLFAPAEVWPLQVLYSLVDLALVALLLRMAEARWVLLYAWSPLVIKELSFTAHPDGVGVFLLMLSLFFRQRQYFLCAAVALALSVGAKVFTLLFVPFVLWRMPWRYWVVFSLVLVGLYLPFLFQGGSDLAGLHVFVQRWQFNGSLFPLLGAWFEPLSVKLLLGCVFLALYAGIFWQHCQRYWQIPRGDLLFAAFFLVAPVVNAWYLVWLLPFAVLFPRLWSWTFSLSVLSSYAIGLNLGIPGLASFSMPLWAALLEYGVVAMAFAVDVWLQYSKRQLAKAA